MLRVVVHEAEVGVEAEAEVVVVHETEVRRGQATSLIRDFLMQLQLIHRRRLRIRLIQALRLIEDASSKPR